MSVRRYEERDLEWIKRIHEKQGFGYPFPDLSDPVFCVGCVSEDERAAAFIRLTSEAYLFMDPEAGTAREQWQSLLEIHAQVRHDTANLGLQDVHIWVPPDLTKKTNTGREAPFVRRLQKLGWGADAWECLSYRIR